MHTLINFTKDHHTRETRLRVSRDSRVEDINTWANVSDSLTLVQCPAIP